MGEDESGTIGVETAVKFVVEVSISRELLENDRSDVALSAASQAHEAMWRKVDGWTP